MKNCTVRLEQMQFPPKQPPQQNELVVEKVPAKAKEAPAAEVDAATSNTANAKAPAIVYDHSCDDDSEDAMPLQTGHEDNMKESFNKLAYENQIEAKECRTKNSKKTKTSKEEKKLAKRATATRKRPREIPLTDAEQPAQKRSKFRNKDVTHSDNIPRATRSSVLKPRFQLSAVKDSDDTKAAAAVDNSDVADERKKSAKKTEKERKGRAAIGRMNDFQKGFAKKLQQNETADIDKPQKELTASNEEANQEQEKDVSEATGYQNDEQSLQVIQSKPNPFSTSKNKNLIAL